MLRMLATLTLAMVVCLTAAAQDKRISVSFTNTAASKAFKKVETLSGCNIQFNYKDANFKVTLSAKNKTAAEVVRMIISGHALDITQKGKYITVVKKKAQPQPKPVEKGAALTASDGIILHGKVLDENGDVLPGANIRIKGTTDGTTTNLDGEYTLITEHTAGTVVYSYVGFKSREMPISSAYGLKSIRLTPSTELDDVVLTGFFDKQKTTFTGSYKKITHDDITEFGTANIFNVLQVLDPSFKIKENNTAGSNPNSLPDFVIRGESSFQEGSSLPTIIVDGYETNVQYLYDMDVERIESITILKDASATVYYGSRAANGVIVIETRRPQAGKLRVSYSNHTGITWADLSSYNLMNASQKLEFERLSGVYSSDDPEQQYKLDKIYESLNNNVQRGIDTYWLSQPLRTAVTQSHSVYAEGGDEVVTYGLNGSYGNTQGVMKGSDRNTFSLSFDLGYRIKDKIQIRNSFSYSASKGNNSPYGSFSNYSEANPYSPIYDEEGNYIKKYEQHSGQNHYNYLYNATLPHRSYSKSSSILEQFNFDYRITKTLRFKAAVSYNRSTGESQSYTSPNDAQYSNSTVSASDRGSASSGHDESTGWDFNATLANNFMFGKHGVYVGGGVNLTESKSYTESYSVIGFIDDRFNEIGNANSFSRDSKPTSSRTTSRLVGFLGTVNYSYDNRYFVDMSMRLDGSSAYGADHRFGNNWSVGAGWNINNEKFMKGLIPFLDDFRLRGSYGLTGSANFSQDVARTMLKFEQNYLYYETLGATFIQYGNRNLTWQQNHQMNLGLDFGLAKRRLNLTFDYYINNTDGLLLPVTVAPSLGFSSYTENFGEIENRGWNFNVNAVVIRKKDFDWALSFSAAHNSNKIKKINDALSSTNKSNELSGQMGTKENSKPVTQYEEGQSMSVIKVVPSLGINPANGKELYRKKDGTVTEVWDSDDKVVVGDTEPTISGSFGTNFVYKRWTLSAAFRYSFGAKAYNSTLAERVEGLNIYNNGDARAFEERWKTPGDYTFYKNIADHSTSYASSRFVQDNDYITLSNVALYYRVPTEWLHRIGISTLKIGANMSDIFYSSTIKQERGLDYPFSRTVSVSLNLTF